MPYGKIKAKPVDGFDSRLEKMWAEHFELARIEYEYMGDKCRWCDFLLHGFLPVEIKPNGDAFLAGAMRRLPEGQSVLIVCGEPRSHACVWCEFHDECETTGLSLDGFLSEILGSITAQDRWHQISDGTPANEIVGNLFHLPEWDYFWLDGDEFKSIHEKHKA